MGIVIILSGIFILFIALAIICLIKFASIDDHLKSLIEKRAEEK